MVFIQTNLRQTLADGLGLPLHLHCGPGQLPGLLIADGKVTAHMLDSVEQARQLILITPRALRDFADLAFQLDRKPGDIAQVLAGQLDLLDPPIQIGRQLANLLHDLCGTLLDIRDHLPYLACGAGSAASETTDFVGNHGETASVLASPRRFDGGIERQQVGLAGNRLNDQRHTLDLFAALAQRLDQLAAADGTLAQAVHAFDGLIQHAAARFAALPRLAGGNQRLLTQLGRLLFGGDHLLGTADDLFGSPQLRLHLAGQVPDRKSHLGRGQRVMTGGARQVAGQQGDIAVSQRALRQRWPAAHQARQPDHQQGQRNDDIQRQARNTHGGEQQTQDNALHRRHPPPGCSVGRIGQRQSGCHG